jgi:hypothetical protein
MAGSTSFFQLVLGSNPGSTKAWQLPQWLMANSFPERPVAGMSLESRSLISFFLEHE